MKVLNSGKALVLATLAVFSLNFAYAQPANDGCAGAIAIACGQTLTGSNATATNDAVPACGLSAPRKGVWYTITGTGGQITLSTCSSTTNFDTQIAVYTGACTGLTCVVANDNDAACSNFFNRLSTVSFPSTFGTVYRIMVAGKVGSAGTFTLAATCAVVAPANDVCTSAVALACGASVTGSTAGATIDAVGTCTTSLNTAGGVWYTVVGNGADITVSTCNPGTDFDTKLGVFSGTCAGLVCVGGNDDTTAPECVLPSSGFNRKSRVTFASVSGTTYYVLVTGFSTLVGNFQLTVTCGTPPPPPTSFNECAGAITLTPGATCVPTAGTTVGATQSIAPATCSGFTSNGALDVWYKFVATQANHVVIAGGGTTFDVVLQAFSGACNGTSLGCIDGQILSGAPEVLSLTGLTPGQTYLIRIYGWFSSTGAFTVCVTNGATSLVDGTAGTLVDYQQTPETLQVGDIYPNPAQFGQAFMKIATPEEAVATIQLFDQAGRVVRNMETELYSGVNEIELDVNNLAKGTYFAAIRVNNEVFRKKLIVMQ